MWTRIVRALGAFVVLVLIAGSAVAASSVWKQYTLPAAPPKQVASPGTMTLLLPAGWRVTTDWNNTTGAGATDPVHMVYWSATVLVENKSTTITDIRKRMLHWAGTPMWGEGTPMRQYVSDSYVNLPMGKVWRYTLAWVPQKKGETKFKLAYQRSYVLDRGIVATTGGSDKHLFNWFMVACSAKACKSHNGQLATIMRSIRLTP